MNYVSVGDMAQTYLLRRHNVQLKTTMSRLTQELASGVQQDVGAAVKGDFTALAAIDRSQRRIDSFSQSASEADVFLSSQQDALELIQNHASQIGATMISSASTTQASMIDAVTGDAAQRFASIVSALNVNVAGRYVFSGNTTDTAPLGASEDIISALSGVITGMTNATDIVSAVDDWFDAPTGGGGFLDFSYHGSDTALAPAQVSETDRADLSLTAADPSLRNLLKGFALATLVSENLVPDDIDVRATLTRAAGEQIATADAELTTVRSELGTVQEIVSDAQVRNSAEKSSLAIAKNKLIGIDEYDSATALEAVQTQLETLYTLTARLTGLSLTDYL
ncbi:MAG: flagellin [Paenirhodobacter sp.]|uniref:flagellin n=1 Tax=Paenirhodobacter sp. TaxID=1965326 RepID=UPI003D0AC7BE